MGSRRALTLWLILAAFVVEVLSPTTAFVRERPDPIHHGLRAPGVVKIIKARRRPAHPGSAASLNDDGDDDAGTAVGDEYVACSGLVPTVFLPPPLELGGVHVPIEPSTPGEPVTQSLQRPPARA